MPTCSFQRNARLDQIRLLDPSIHLRFIWQDIQTPQTTLIPSILQLVPHPTHLLALHYTTTMAPSPTIRRLLRETLELSPSSPSPPNPTFHAQPVSDTDLFEWHFTLIGPPAPSPYSRGIYHGRITLPPTYPLKPPNFRFLTPSGRFETNREICLSISGFHEETWMPAWGVRTALIALRGFMAEQGTAGQVGGLEAGEGVRRKLAEESRGWRCEGCGGGRSNEEVMEGWWEVCRGRGVKVGEGGEEGGLGLEKLPDGLELEVREKSERKELGGGDSREDEEAENRPIPAATSTGMQPLPPPLLRPSNTAATTTDTSQQFDASHLRHRQPPAPIPSPNSSTPLLPTFSQASSSLQQPQSTSQPLPSSPSEHQPLPLPTDFQRQVHTVEVIAPADRNTSSTGTIDRAIGAIVLALCLMILKKIFYPAQSSSALDENSFWIPEGL